MSHHGHGQGGCGGACQCSGGGGGHPTHRIAPAINGIVLAEPGEDLDEQALIERAWAELLRQEAVRRGLLPRHADLSAPALSSGDQAVIERMLDGVVPLAQASHEECRRYYDASPGRYVQGQAVRMRHILFAVTDGVDVDALARHAEAALLDLLHKDAPATRFAERAGELSNCPSGPDGGEVGWVGPADIAEELARELFHTQHPPQGLMTRLVHSRWGLHIVDVQERHAGEQLPFEAVHGRIAAELAQRSRATALHQYIRVLAGGALVEGVALEAAQSPLLQ